MSEELPLSLQKKLLEKMMKAAAMKEAAATQPSRPQTPWEIVKSALSDERAKELLEQAREEYPEAAEYAVSVIAQLVQRGALKEIDGATLLTLLRRLGVPIRPRIRIRFVKDGKEVSMKEYLED